ncbi:MAG: TRAP transporter substrate-binding protein [Hyphomonas sp.]|uniref:TAXI family TRAP transporter solute-binding subunit n=1 Tax=Hyphomonas sp. TaxID=87 RepID=UPI0017AB0245|nr:TAXI family TRAP transporter solute-binding subunit [Hyphomonas sp.]MBU3920535.1 ABC transporter substrate-binding protein [Alphaproteobacteria bacterium]MBA3068515.1 TRAP transporter substrate-binding protein [Hyphomonas sp.]MBU4060617.1 ABC transporter substrate-binding protein [Alphaproteobacteria bacterium]MBU4164601.1 ABC transporter substrate-binding protein [Alphaproteobacteria bacterium]MBU4568899.1 ABC transporter substrate-binding protein [Alphaproteobacteria bacterium]
MQSREMWRIYGPVIALAIAGFVAAYFLMDPAPPKTVRFGAGAPGGAYHVYAERYQRLLAEQGVEVELVDTAGSIDNLRLLDEGFIDIALVQGGLTGSSEAKKLRSLGGLFEEPFWVFLRNGVPAGDFGDLRTLRLSIGPDGSGTRALAASLQTTYGGDWPKAARMSLPTADAVAALRAGEIDAAAFAASPDAPYVQDLLRAEGIHLLAFERAEAIARRDDGLSSVVLLRGIADIGADIPARDVPLVAAVSQLVVREDIHPAIEAVLLDAAGAIHAEPSLFSPSGRFPNLTNADLPVSRQTTRFYRDGPSFLRRYFPFSVANFLDRAWVLAIPLLTLAFPLVRAAPPIYRWRVRRRIYVWYKDLRALEDEGRATPAGEARTSVLSRLERLQADIGGLDVPLSYNDDLYRLRSHVEFVKQLLGAPPKPATAG